MDAPMGADVTLLLEWGQVRRDQFYQVRIIIWDSGQ